MAINKTTNWHFPRLLDADFYIRQFEQDLPALTLYAPRGKGVTEFLQTDLSDAAKRKGYVPIYASLWQAQQSPAMAICDALRSSYAARTFWQRFTEYLTATAKKSEFEIGHLGPKFKTEFDHELPKFIGDEALIAMPHVLDEAHEHHGNKKLVLIIDQIQTLVGRPGYDSFIRSLRATLDSRKQYVHAVFAGSSRTRLGQVFRPVESPMHNFAQPYDFPDMPAGYLVHMEQCFHELTGKHLALDHLQEAFGITNQRPGYLHVATRMAINALDRHEPFDIRDLARSASDSLARESGMRERYFSLAPLAQLVLVGVSQGVQPNDALLFEHASNRLAGPFEAGHIQNAVNALTTAQILYVTSAGIYEIEDASFASWIEQDLPKLINTPNFSKSADLHWPIVIQRIDLKNDLIKNLTYQGTTISEFAVSLDAFAILKANDIDIGFMDGGCKIFADAVGFWSAGATSSAYALDASSGRVQHVVARYGEVYFDHDGIGREVDILKKMLSLERVDCYMADSAPSDILELLSSPKASTQLAADLERKFGSFESFMARAHDLDQAQIAEAGSGAAAVIRTDRIKKPESVKQLGVDIII